MTAPVEQPTSPVIAPRAFPGLWASIGWVVLFFAMQIGAGVVMFGVAMAMDDSGRGFAELTSDLKFLALPTIWGLVLASLIMLVSLWFYLRKADRVASIKLDRWSRLSAANTIGLAVFAIGAGLAFNYAYATYIVPDVEMQATLNALLKAIPETLPNTVLLFVAIAIIAPVLEEVLFRGLLQNSLAHRMPTWAAILIASAIFGAAHLDLTAFAPLMAMGIAFGFLYYKTGSLRVNIAMHVVNNAAAILLS